ncbi:50S ribosomal protein L31e [Candidatus Pyrohabitans sp.]
MERVYTVRFHKIKRTPRTKRAAKAVRYLRRFIARHMKSERVRIDEGLNQALWRRGIQKIPSKLRVRAEKQDDGSVVVSLES